MMTSNSSPGTWCYLPWLHTAMFLVLSTTFYTPILVSSKIDIRNYSKHCASVVPESTPNDVPEFTTIPFAAEQGGYFLGGEDILNHPNSSRNYYPSSSRRELFIHTHNVYSTDADDVYKVEASLILKTSDMLFYMYDDTSPRGPLSFEVEGFWSESTGKLCMVGSGSTSSEEGKHHVLPALLKLDGVRNSSTIRSLVGGTLESLSTAGDSGYFKPISLLMIPQNHYEYTEVGKALDHVCTGGVAVPKSSSLSLKQSTPICNAFSRWDIAYKLEYSSGCNSTSSCNPFGEGAGYLPQIMSLKVIQCLEDIRRLRFQIEFSNSSYADYYYRPFNPNTTLVAEASWDVNKNQLCVVGCRIFNPANSLKKSRIEDCSVRLSFRFPSVWSIGHTSGTVGHIWSNKRENDPGYFNTIMFRSDENAAVGIPGSKYEYTVVDKARKSCTEKQPRKSKGKRHPDANSNDMRFGMVVRNSKRRGIGWGSSEPIAVGDQISRRNDFVMSSSSGAAYSPVKGETNSSIPMSISYSMSFQLNESPRVDVFSEGIYDAETGKLCMVGCRYLDSNNRTSDNDSMDCKILINVQFPPVDSNDHIQGTIESTGGKNDPLFLEPLSFSAVSYYRQHSRESIWRMDLEIIMSLISNTLVCVFVGCQILYVKKHPAVFPFISLIMLAVLALGCVIPLMLNFEALFVPKDRRLTTAYRRSGGWVEANEVIVRVIMMVAFLLQFRLLQLVWCARSADGKQKAFLAAEMRTLYLCLPLYICGGLIAVYVNSRGNTVDEATGYTYSSSYQRSLWADLRSYGGLVLDGFLFPQILLNIFQNSAENALSRFFYFGNTFVRLLPHAYDLYRAHFYVEDFDGSYMYAEPGGDYFSTAWDVIIPLVTLLFAAVIYLQQRFGGRCFMPKRLKEPEGYEKVPVASDHA